MLGLAHDLVLLTDHDDSWHAEFFAERERIGAGIEGLGCEMEHVGSTAVPGLAAKPILDIAVVRIPLKLTGCSGGT
jgi:GrpB-like predicted nucleotidyltransferase (UPF0157 family)